MKLVLGGMASGKRDFVCALGYQKTDFGSTFDAPVLCSLNEWVRQQRKQQKEVLAELELQLKKAPDVTVICTEVGCGIVPMEREEREYRELVGRCCIVLAQQAEEVYRLHAGLAVRLK